MVPQDIDQYVDWILQQKPELSEVEPEVRDQLKKDLVTRLEDQINAAILDALPKADLPVFEQLVQTATPAEVSSFCEQRIPKLEGLVAAVLVRFKLAYLGA